MRAQVATREWAHCTVTDARLAVELSRRWQAGGYMVAEHALAPGGVRMYVAAQPSGESQTIDPKLAGAVVQLGIVGADLAGRRRFKTRRITGSVTLPIVAQRGQPVWSVEPLESLGVELHVRDDDDAFAQLDVLAIGLGMPRANITIKPRHRWCGYGDPRLDSRRQPRPPS